MPLHVSLSLSHRQDCNWMKLRQYAKRIVNVGLAGEANE